jgi:hypothetical protein
MAIFSSRKDKRNLEIHFQKDMLYVRLSDGREQAFPLAWFPRLQEAREEDLQDWKLSDDGTSIRWNKLNEQLDITGL